MLQEIALLRSLSFDGNIVQFYGACLQKENTMMVLEYMGVSFSCHRVTMHRGTPCMPMKLWAWYFGVTCHGEVQAACMPVLHST